MHFPNERDASDLPLIVDLWLIFPSFPFCSFSLFLVWYILIFKRGTYIILALNGLKRTKTSKRPHRHIHSQTSALVCEKKKLITVWNNQIKQMKWRQKQAQQGEACVIRIRFKLERVSKFVETNLRALPTIIWQDQRHGTNYVASVFVWIPTNPFSSLFLFHYFCCFFLYFFLFLDSTLVPI